MSEDPASRAVRGLEGKYLTFKLGDEEFGIQILKVQEIIKMMEVTRVPRTPDFVRGVINLRGKVIPVLALRMKFGLEEVPLTAKTCIIVTQIQSESKTVTTGVIVDEVSEVLDVTGEQIEASPEFGSSVDTTFLLGIGKVAKRVVMLLDVDQVISHSQTSMLQAG